MRFMIYAFQQYFVSNSSDSCALTESILFQEFEIYVNTLHQLFTQPKHAAQSNTLQSRIYDRRRKDIPVRNCKSFQKLLCTDLQFIYGVHSLMLAVSFNLAIYEPRASTYKISNTLQQFEFRLVLLSLRLLAQQNRLGVNLNMKMSHEFMSQCLSYFHFLQCHNKVAFL